MAEIEDIEKIVSFKCKVKNIKVDPWEIINSTYERCGQITDNFLRECDITIKELLREKSYSSHEHLTTNDQYKTCKKCKETKPISEFGNTNVYRYGGSYINTYCIDCVRKHVDEWRIENNKRYNERMKRHKKKAREELTDYYIKQLLRNKYSMEYIDNHPELIVKKREKLILFRQKRKEREGFKF